MNRRTWLAGAGLTAAAAAGAVVLWRPSETTQPHDKYFQTLNDLLKSRGPGRPVMVIDKSRMNANIDALVASVGPDKTYRVVVKSLPSVPLLDHVMRRADTTALMVFHQPFLNAVAQAFPASDALLGKPMPVAAARTFYAQLARSGTGGFDPASQVQWLIDSHERLQQYLALARQLGVKMRVNFEIDVGLHRGGYPDPESIGPSLALVDANSGHLETAGLMGYEPHLTGLAAGLDHPRVTEVLNIYRGFIDRLGTAAENMTLNGAGSHTLGIYEKDRTMNDLAAGSGVVKPTDFDTFHLSEQLPAVFIATPILKRYDQLQIPGDPWAADLMQWWDPNRRRVYYIYGGYWKARYASPAGIPEGLYHSTNQSPVTTSTAVDLEVDDYIFLRPTQSEHVMLQFGDLVVYDGKDITERWPVFQQT